MRDGSKTALATRIEQINYHQWKASADFLQSLRDAADDGKITPLEKKELQKIQTGIVAEYPCILRDASAANIPQTHTAVLAYKTAYDQLKTALDGILQKMEETTSVDRELFLLQITAYHEQRGAVIEAITAGTTKKINTIDAAIGGGNGTSYEPRVAPNLKAAMSHGRVICLTIEREPGLAGIIHYELQISRDQSSWWAVGLPADWKGVLDGVTDIGASENHVITGLPLHENTATVYFFRCRAKTTKTSPWSNTASATIGPWGPGDLAAGAVTRAALDPAFVTEHDSVIEDLETETKARIAAVTAVDGKIEATIPRINQSELKQALLEDVLNAHEDAMLKINQSLAVEVQQTEGDRTKLTRVAVDVDGIKETVAEIGPKAAKIVQVEKTVDGITEKIADYDETKLKLTEVEKTADGVKTTVQDYSETKNRLSVVEQTAGESKATLINYGPRLTAAKQAAEQANQNIEDLLGNRWVPEKAYAVGDRIAERNKAYTCVTAGTTGATEPAWPEGDVTDGGVTWRYDGQYVADLSYFRHTAEKFEAVVASGGYTDEQGVFHETAAHTKATQTAEAFGQFASAGPNKNQWANWGVANDEINAVVAKTAEDAAADAKAKADAVKTTLQAEIGTTKTELETAIQNGDTALADELRNKLAAITAPAWAASTAYAKGARIIGGTRYYEAKVAGTSGATEPTWTDGDVADGSVTWACLGAVSGADAAAETKRHTTAIADLAIKSDSVGLHVSELWSGTAPPQVKDRSEWQAYLEDVVVALEAGILTTAQGVVIEAQDRRTEGQLLAAKILVEAQKIALEVKRATKSEGELSTLIQMTAERICMAVWGSNAPDQDATIKSLIELTAQRICMAVWGKSSPEEYPAGKSFLAITEEELKAKVSGKAYDPVTGETKPIEAVQTISLTLPSKRDQAKYNAMIARVAVPAAIEAVYTQIEEQTYERDADGKWIRVPRTMYVLKALSTETPTPPGKISRAQWDAALEQARAAGLLSSQALISADDIFFDGEISGKKLNIDEVAAMVFKAALLLATEGQIDKLTSQNIDVSTLTVGTKQVEGLLDVNGKILANLLVLGKLAELDSLPWSEITNRPALGALAGKDSVETGELGTTIIKDGKLINDLIDTLSLIARKLKIDSDPASNQDFELDINETVGIKARYKNETVFQVSKTDGSITAGRITISKGGFFFDINPSTGTLKMNSDWNKNVLTVSPSGASFSGNVHADKFSIGAVVPGNTRLLIRSARIAVREQDAYVTHSAICPVTGIVRVRCTCEVSSTIGNQQRGYYTCSIHDEYNSAGNSWHEVLYLGQSSYKTYETEIDLIEGTKVLVTVWTRALNLYVGPMEILIGNDLGIFKYATF